MNCPNQVPAPATIVQYASNTNVFGLYRLKASIALTQTKCLFDFSLSDEAGNRPFDLVMRANVWFVDGQYRPGTIHEDTFKVTGVCPDTNPGGTNFPISIIDGAAHLEIEHNGNQRAWWICVEVNGIINFFGPYALVVS